MPYLIAIDPGEVKCGVALFQCKRGPEGEAKLLIGVRPETKDLFSWIEKISPRKPVICYEDFFLYPNYRKGGTGPIVRNLEAHRLNEMKTSQSIGVIKFAIERFNLVSYHCMATVWKGKVKDNTLKQHDLWRRYSPDTARHIRDASGIGWYWHYYKGIFNDGQRVYSLQEREMLDASM